MARPAIRCWTTSTISAPRSLPSPRWSRRRSKSSWKRGVGALVLTDAAAPKRAERDMLAAWVEAGGVLLRFSGPRLAESGADLLPVPLRRGRRELGGALTWARPQRLGAVFRDGSVRRPRARRRHCRDPPGARRTGPGACGAKLGDACRRHAGRHRGAPRGGMDGAGPYLRQCRLVHARPFRPLSADAGAPCRARPGDGRHRRGARAGAAAGRIRPVGGARPGRLAAAGRLDGRGGAGPGHAAGPLRAGRRVPGGQSRPRIVGALRRWPACRRAWSNGVSGPAGSTR